jgi:flavin-binding protein dodecin
LSGGAKRLLDRLAQELHAWPAGARDCPQSPKEDSTMSVARVTELSCTSTESFEDAIRQGIERANKTLRGVRSAWVKEQRVMVNRENAIEFQANILVTFVLEE